MNSVKTISIAAATALAVATGALLIMALSEDDEGAREAAENATDLFLKAALAGNVDGLKKQLEAGTDIESKNNDGTTALHTAAFFGQVEAVEFLLASGANPWAENIRGETSRETVSAKWSDVEAIYRFLEKALETKLDYDHIEGARPKIAKILKASEYSSQADPAGGSKVEKALNGAWAPEKEGMFAMLKRKAANEKELAKMRAISDKIIIEYKDGKTKSHSPGKAKESTYEILSSNDATGEIVLNLNPKGLEKAKGKIDGDTMRMTIDGDPLIMNRLTAKEYESHKKVIEAFDSKLAP